jgi:peptidyl-prolyl cis-trans isomerase C
MLKERTSQGQPDSPDLRAALREELNTRELLAREAKKKGMDKQSDIKTQMDLSSQTVLVRAYVADWIKTNPIPEADIRKEYDAIKSQLGDKEYKVAHILVEKEDEAKEVIAELQKGGKFADIAKARSKDPGSKDRGGDLDWNAPANFVKPFSDAMVKAEKGKFTPQPVQTQFGWHVLLVEDTRDAKVPGYDEVKPQLAQRMQAQHLDKYFRDLRTKNGL